MNGTSRRAPRAESRSTVLMARQHSGCRAAGHAGAPNAETTPRRTLGGVPRGDSAFQRRTRGAEDAAMSVEEEGAPPPAPSALLGDPSAQPGDGVELPRPLPALMRRSHGRHRERSATPAPGDRATAGAEPLDADVHALRRAHTE